jgi:FlaG/FlaF family flagellin (archaellin)
MRKKVPMQTLTDGRYDEFPDFAETTYVGSAVYDVYNKRIVGFIKRDTLYSEATLEPDVVSRWLSTDPVFHPYESPYTAFANNPVYFVDPRGTTVGDYVTTSSEKIGSDGIKDGQVHVVTDEKEVNKIRKLTSQGKNVVVDEVKSKVTLPSLSVREQMGQAVDDSYKPTADDTRGGFHEEGGVVKNGAVFRSYPGSVLTTDPKTGKGEIDVFNVPPIIHREVGETLPFDFPVDETFHVHPYGEKEPTQERDLTRKNTTSFKASINSVFSENPSPADLSNAQKRAGIKVTGNNYVLSPRFNKVSIYNGSGVKATFPLDKFRTYKAE